MTHDELKEIIAQAYFTLPQLNCRFCKYKTPLPQQGVGTVVTEHQTRQFKADVAALSQQGETVAIIEVVNTHPPTTKVLQAQSELEAAFYVEMDALDNRFEGYCSPFCWTNGKRTTCHPEKHRHARFVDDIITQWSSNTNYSIGRDSPAFTGPTASSARQGTMDANGCHPANSL